MNQYFLRVLRLLLGLLLYSLGVVATLKANIGYAPWDVFHSGLAHTLGVSIGLASIAAGVVITAVTAALGERLGLGTILNMVLIGLGVDLFLYIDFLPAAPNFAAGAATLIAGLFIISFASYFYIGSAFGAGPRDSLMVAITRRTKLPVGACRGAIEIFVVVVGWLLGGMVGAGTVISAMGIGICVQLVFKLMKFDPTMVKHESFGIRRKEAEAAKEKAENEKTENDNIENRE